MILLSVVFDYYVLIESNFIGQFVYSAQHCPNLYLLGSSPVIIKHSNP